VLSNVEEMKARGAVIIAVGNEGDEELVSRADHFIAVPRTDPFLSPLATVIPRQLYAYHAALRRGCEIDQPRNLAKTVTVE
jgi:glucosamine--fructose-6-phosphate aminotransferase (isomerizing)